MFVKVVSSRVFLNVLISLTVIAGGLFLWAAWNWHEIKKGEKSKKKKSSKYKEKEKKWKIRIKNVTVIAVLLLILTVAGFIQREQYVIKDKFKWEENREIEVNQLFSADDGSTSQDVLEKCKQQLHYEWYIENLEQNEGIVKMADIGTYRQKMKYIIFAVPERSDAIDWEALEGVLKRRYELWQDKVQKDIKTITIEELWDGYGAGVDIGNAYSTGEVTYQTGVMAENAQFKGCNMTETLLYASGAVSKFEEFLKYVNRNVGYGIQVDELEIAFRIGKVLYREGKSKYNADNMKIHCMLLAYTCFEICSENTEINDESNLLYHYYDCLAYLELLPLVAYEELEEYRKIGDKKLEKWNEMESVCNGEWSGVYKMGELTNEKISIIRQSIQNNIAE